MIGQYYCALIYLCKRAPYTGSATELADFSHCGKKMTALRMLSSLQKKGLIRITTDGISLAQIEPSSAQNETVSAQSETILKEKRTKKENINIIIKEKESESYIVSPAPAMIKKENIFIAPTWSEWWAFAKEKQMGMFEAQKSFSYYSMRGWKDISNWKAALVYWDMKNKT